MNKYGLILNDIGFTSLDAIQVRVHALAQAAAFAREAAAFDDHHSFIVAYSADEDAHLDMHAARRSGLRALRAQASRAPCAQANEPASGRDRHTDDSDVTLNVCLGQNFSGAGLTFCGDVGDADHRALSHRYSHVPGRALLHRIGRRRHGADTIASGRRVNLIMWNYCKEWRASAAAASAGCATPPRRRRRRALRVVHARPRLRSRGRRRARMDTRTRRTRLGARRSAEYEGFVGGEGRHALRRPDAPGPRVILTS